MAAVNQNTVVTKTNNRRMACSVAVGVVAWPIQAVGVDFVAKRIAVQVSIATALSNVLVAPIHLALRRCVSGDVAVDGEYGLSVHANGDAIVTRQGENAAVAILVIFVDEVAVL
jgi:hypothetical protein